MVSKIVTGIVAVTALISIAMTVHERVLSVDFENPLTGDPAWKFSKVLAQSGLAPGAKVAVVGEAPTAYGHFSMDCE